MFFLRTCITMSFNKEKERLKELLTASLSVDVYNESTLEVLNECYKEYSTIIKSLVKKQPNIFGNLNKYDLSDIKNNKRYTKESFSDEAREKNFIVYKDSIVHAVERTIEYITDYL